MKVLCIDDSNLEYGFLKYGDVYTVIGEENHMGLICYFLEEIVGESYVKTRFIPLSEIDETEFERNYNKELV